MRKLGLRKITIETGITIFDRGRPRQVMVTVVPPGRLELRLKGLRGGVACKLDAVYWACMKGKF